MSQPQFTFTLPPPLPQHPKPRFSKALWLIGIALLANAAVLWTTRGQMPDLVLDRAALAQATPTATGGPSPMLGARGIYMMPAQLGPNSYGLYLMDVDSSTICVYRAEPDSSKLRFMASRSFKYDRFMEDFNTEGLRPKDVQKLVEQQQQRTGLQEKGDQPTVDQTTKPSENLPDTPKPDAPK